MKKRSLLVLILALSIIFSVFSFGVSAIETDYFNIEIPEGFSAVEGNTYDDAWWYNEKDEYINIAVFENEYQLVYTDYEEYIYTEEEFYYVDDGTLLTADKITYAADLPVVINEKAGYKFCISGVNRITGEAFVTEHYYFSTADYDYRFSISTRGENAAKTCSAIASTITFPGNVLNPEDVTEDESVDYYNDAYEEILGNLGDDIDYDDIEDIVDGEEMVEFLVVYFAIISLVVIVPIVVVIIVVIKHNKDEKRKKAQILEMYGRMYQNQTSQAFDSNAKSADNFAAEEMLKEKEELSNNENI